MALTITHPFVSAVVDENTPGEVGPDEWNDAHSVAGTLDAAQFPALTGDITTSAGSVATTLATVNGNVGTFGSATAASQVTVNAKGLVTAAANVAITPAASSITGGAALTKTDDTNVTLTLGGAPTTALLTATSVTVGWTGTLAIARGGTGAGDAATAFGNIKQAASETATGVVELATDAETVTGTDTARAVTPANVTARLAAPGAIGGTTAAAGSFTALAASGLISANGGQIAFPATANPSANANTLDDYEEGSWTPVLTFATPGDQSIAYTTQAGRYIKIGMMVLAEFAISTSTFTHTTAAGGINITGIPFSSLNVAGVRSRVGCLWQGITKANYTDMAATLAENSSIISIAASGSGQSAVAIAVGDMPTGGGVRFDAALGYIADS